MNHRRSRDTSRTDELATVLRELGRIVEALHRSSRATERRLGITGAQLFILQTLAEAPVQALNELAARTHTHQSSVSVVVTRLVARRLVRRTTSPIDARRVTIDLTPAGRALLQRAPEPAQVRLIAGLQRFSRSERRSLAQALEKLVREAGIEEELPSIFLEETLRPRVARGDRRRRG